MDVIEYLKEENLRIRKLIQRLITNYRIWSRDEVFDRVREICDGIMVHLNKQDHLLLQHILIHESLKDSVHTVKGARSAVEDEVGRLVEVHVDEPEYVKCLDMVLRQVIDLANASEDLYDGIRKTLSKEESDALTENFKAHLFQSGAGFDAMTTHPGVQDISVNDRL